MRLKVASGDCEDCILDTDKIELTSIAKNEIKLPYAGRLPKELQSSSNAYIFCKINPLTNYLPISLRLWTIDNDGKKVSHEIDFTTDEAISLLDRFFGIEGGKPSKTGLSSYWKGVFDEKYLTWRKIMTVPGSLISILMALPEDKLSLLLQRLDRCRNSK